MFCHDNTFIFHYVAEEFYICSTCRQFYMEKKSNGTIYINVKYDNIRRNIEIFVKKNKQVTGFYKQVVKAEIFDFFNISNIPWFHLTKDNICQLCTNDKKYYNHVCKQCYNFSLNIIYQQYRKVLLIKDILDIDIYFTIHWITLYLINYDLGATYQLPKPIAKEIVVPKIVVNDVRNNEVIVEVDDDYLTYIAGNIEEPDYDGLGYYQDSEEY